jgi:hypothetical protein
LPCWTEVNEDPRMMEAVICDYVRTDQPLWQGRGAGQRSGVPLRALLQCIAVALERV